MRMFSRFKLFNFNVRLIYRLRKLCEQINCCKYTYYGNAISKHTTTTTTTIEYDYVVCYSLNDQLLYYLKELVFG